MFAAIVLGDTLILVEPTPAHVSTAPHQAWTGLRRQDGWGPQTHLFRGLAVELRRDGGRVAITSAA